MGEIRIGPGAMTLILLGILAVTGAVLASEMPDVKRYLKMKQM